MKYRITAFSLVLLVCAATRLWLPSSVHSADDLFGDEASDPFGANEESEGRFGEGNEPDPIGEGEEQAPFEGDEHRDATDDSNPAPDGDGTSPSRMALRTKTDFDFNDTSLQDVIQIIGESHSEVNFLLDSAALDLIGIDPETPITLRLKQVPLEVGLQIMLKGLGLVFVADEKNGIVEITTMEEAESRTSIEVYPVHDMLNEDEPNASANTLIGAITTVIEADSWEKVGGPATISFYQGNLIVSQTAHGHRNIDDLLTKLRTGIYAVGGPIYPEAPIPACDDSPPAVGSQGGGGMF